MKRKVVASPSEEEPSKEAVVIYIGQFFLVFFFLQANCLASFSTPDLPWDLPHLGTFLWGGLYLSAKVDLEVKASGRNKTH